MRRLLAVGGLFLLVIAGTFLASIGFAGTTIERERSFEIAAGSSLSQVANDLEKSGAIPSARMFLLRAKLLSGPTPIQAGEFLLTPGMSQSELLTTFQSGDVIRRFVTIPEGMPSILVHERLMAEELLSGEVDVPAEGSILPDTYDFSKGEERAQLIGRMQAAMDQYLQKAWAARKDNIAVTTMREALILASIVEKETGLAKERRMIAGLYSNRLKKPMPLQADPTIIYPITRGKPLGRRIRQSEIAAINGYNTYMMMGLPNGPITNPGRESIAAVLDPAPTTALFMVADGSGGHAFAESNAEHEANVEKWYALRRARGEM